MKTLFRFVISSLVMLMCLNISIAQDEDIPIPYPPITPDNASQLQMIQVLSKGEPRAFSWSPDGKQLAITAEGGTWIYDVTDADMPSHYVTGHDLSPRILYAPYHPIYVSYDSHYDCAFGDCEHGQKIYVRDATTHEILHEIERGFNTVVQFSPDGLLMAVLTRSGGIRIWETASFLTQTADNPNEFMLCRIATPAMPVAAIFSPDSTLISYTGSDASMMDPDDPTIWFWDTRTCEIRFQEETLVPNEPIRAYKHFASFIDYSRDGRYLITPQSKDKKYHVYLWDMQTFEKITELSSEIAPSPRAIVRFSYDSQHILFQDEDRIKFWEIASGTVVKEYVGNNAFYLDVGTLVIIRGTHFVLITEEGERAFPEYRYPITNFHLSADGRWLLSQHDYKPSLLWDMEQTTLIGEFDRSATFSPDGKYLVWQEHGVSILELETQALVQLDDFAQIGQSIYWSKSDKILVTHSNINLVDVWTYHGETFERLWHLAKSGQNLKGITDLFIILSQDDDEQIQFLDIYTGEQIASVPVSECAGMVQSNPYCEAWVNALFNRGDGYSDPNIRLPRDSMSFEVLHPITREVIDTYPIPNELAFITRQSTTWRVNADGELLVATRSSLYNLNRNELILSMPHHQAGTFSCNSDCDDGENAQISYYYIPLTTWLTEDLKFLISIEQEDEIRARVPRWVLGSMVRVWDVQTGEEVYNTELVGESSVDFSPDMQWFFQLMWDSYMGGGHIWFSREVNVFDGRTGNRVASLPTFRSNASSASFSPDNRFLLIHSDTLRVWAVVPEDNTP